jgi:hypothetical protein
MGISPKTETRCHKFSFFGRQDFQKRDFRKREIVAARSHRFSFWGNAHTRLALRAP